MRIIVISLRRSTDRRNSIERQFQRLQIPFEFFNAITPDAALRHFERYDRDEFIRNCGRYATATELACYASHLTLWRKCARERVPYLILEDDAKLERDFPAGLRVTANLVRRLGLVRVSLPGIRSGRLVNRVGPFAIKYCLRAPLLALGYGISPASAERLAKAATTVEEPVDKFMQRFWRHGQPVFAVTPPIVMLADVAERSDIGMRARYGTGERLWLRRARRKAQNAIQRTLYNLRFSSRIAAYKFDNKDRLFADEHDARRQLEKR